MHESPVNDQILGMLLGLAIGDALGAAVEFKVRGTFEPVTGYRGGGPWNLGPGEWTDDTSMALALADSIIHCGWDLNDQAKRWVRWMDHGEYSVNGRCFDIGNTTRSALRRFKESGDPRSSGQSDTYSSGNGALMRLAPIPASHQHLSKSDPAHLLKRAIESTAVTHASGLCVAASAWMCLALCDLIDGLTLDDILSSAWRGYQLVQRAAGIPDELAPVFLGEWRSKREDEIKSTGYVVHSLEAALWSIYDSVSFEQAVLRAVNLGGDADTIGAIAGQFAGARWGMEGIPARLAQDLANSCGLIETLTDFARRFSYLNR